MGERRKIPPVMMTDFVSLLYADQLLEQLVPLRSERAPLGAFQLLCDAYQLDRAGKRKEAEGILSTLMQTPTEESRVRLWAAAQLRSWGIMPSETDANVAMGAVLTIARANGNQSIAAYLDGSMRYVVGGVPLAIFDGGDRVCDDAIRVILGRANYMLHAQEIQAGSERPHIALLTFGGTVDATNRSGANDLIESFAKLLSALGALRGRSTSREFPLPGRRAKSLSDQQKLVPATKPITNPD